MVNGGKIALQQIAYGNIAVVEVLDVTPDNLESLRKEILVNGWM